MDLSPEFILSSEIKKTFSEFYGKEFNGSELDIKDNISKKNNVKSMFDILFDRVNSLNLYIMEDLHLNNLVMNLTNDRLLVIYTIPIEQTKKIKYDR